jgi:hypothetical protein
MRVIKTIFDRTSKAELFFGLQSSFDSMTKADLFYVPKSGISKAKIRNCRNCAVVQSDVKIQNGKKWMGLTIDGTKDVGSGA